jgi:hypothetical protein
MTEDSMMDVDENLRTKNYSQMMIYQQILQDLDINQHNYMMSLVEKNELQNYLVIESEKAMNEIIRLMKEEEMMETEAYRIVADTIIYKGDIPREPMDITNWNFGDEEEEDDY